MLTLKTKIYFHSVEGTLYLEKDVTTATVMLLIQWEGNPIELWPSTEDKTVFNAIIRLEAEEASF